MPDYGDSLHFQNLLTKDLLWSLTVTPLGKKEECLGVRRRKKEIFYIDQVQGQYKHSFVPPPTSFFQMRPDFRPNILNLSVTGAGFAER